MKTNNKNLSKTPFGSSGKQGGGFTRGAGECTSPSSALTRRASECTSPSSALTRRASECTSPSSALTRRVSECTSPSSALTRRVSECTSPSSALTSVRIHAIILLALAASNRDYLPHNEGEFDEWQKNFVTHLGNPWPPVMPGAPAAPVSPLYVYLGIPVERYNEIIVEQRKWNIDFARGGKEADRRSSEIIAKQDTRKEYEAMLRKLCKEFILYNSKTTNEIKRALKLTVPDTEPSPSHGSHLTTLAPDVFLKTMGGGKIDSRFKRPQDKTRGSVPKGFDAELRYVIDMPLPAEPDEIPAKTTVSSSKARFQFEAGMSNKGKTLRAYARWRHKINPDFNSPWTTVMEIVIA